MWKGRYLWRSRVGVGVCRNGTDRVQGGWAEPAAPILQPWPGHEEGEAGACNGPPHTCGGVQPPPTHAWKAYWASLVLGEANLTRTHSHQLGMQSAKAHSKLNQNLHVNKVPRSPMHTFAFTVQSGRQKQMCQAPDMTTHAVTATEEKERGLDILSGVLTRSGVGGQDRLSC